MVLLDVLTWLPSTTVMTRRAFSGMARGCLVSGHDKGP